MSNRYTMDYTWGEVHWGEPKSSYANLAKVATVRTGGEDLAAEQVADVVPVLAGELVRLADDDALLRQLRQHVVVQPAVLLGDAVADATRILYGGSVKSGNIAGFLREGDVDGALVGGASLEVDGFARIVEFRA